MDLAARESSQSQSGVTQIPTDALEEHERWLRSVIFARSTVPDAVDEIYQEVLLAYCNKFNGISESAVEARLFRARNRLRKELRVLNVIEVSS